MQKYEVHVSNLLPFCEADQPNALIQVRLADEVDARIAELTEALRPFASACSHAEDFLKATKFKTVMDARDAFMWQAPRVLCVNDFENARKALKL